MRSITTFFLILILSFILIQCSEDKEQLCSRSDWVGTYLLNSQKECISDSITQEITVYEDTLELSLSTDPDKIVLNGFQFELQECFFGNFMASLTLNANTITYEIGECTALYIRID